MDDALDTCRERLLQDDPGAADVGVEHGLAILGAHRGPAGDVEHALDALHRPAHGAAVGDVPACALGLDFVQMPGARGPPQQQPQLVAALDERSHEMGADEPRAACDQGLAHALMVVRGSPPCGGVIKRRAVTTANTAIVTDSTSYLPDEVIAERGIHRVSLYVTLDGEQRPELDFASDDYADFFKRLRRSEEGATTSQPSVGDFISVYEPLLADGQDIVSIHISAGISGTCESAMQARQQMLDEGKGGERIQVYDSRSSAGGQAIVVLAATRAAAQGGDGGAVLEAAQRARDDLKMWFAIDTLEYLRKGGRIGAAQAFLGSALQIKPILTLEEEITPVERVRTRRRAFERMVDYARERHEDGADAWVVQHIQDHETARHLVEECRQIFGCDPVFVSEIGPVLGAHVGPGLLGVGGVSRELLDG